MSDLNNLMQCLLCAAAERCTADKRTAAASPADTDLRCHSCSRCAQTVTAGRTLIRHRTDQDLRLPVHRNSPLQSCCAFPHAAPLHERFTVVTQTYAVACAVCVFACRVSFAGDVVLSCSKAFRAYCLIFALESVSADLTFVTQSNHPFNQGL